MRAIYTPGGRAYEYAAHACTLYTGCTNGCIYCFAPDIFKTTCIDFHGHATPRAGILSALRKEALTLGTDDLFNAKAAPYNILFSFESDPYPAGSHAITRAALSILRQYGIPYTVLSKRPVDALADLDLYGPGCTLATTLAAPRGTWAKLEPNANSPDERISAIRIARASGHPTWISLEPCIDPDWTMDMIRLTADCCDHYRLGPLNYGNPRYPTPIDWPPALTAILRLCASLKKPIWIKRDLHQHLTEPQLRQLTPPPHYHWTPHPDSLPCAETERTGSARLGPLATRQANSTPLHGIPALHIATGVHP
jgi:hypothetical protein